MENQRNALIVMRANHLLRQACLVPCSEHAFAVLHHLLEYTINTMLDYKGPPGADTIGQLAADSSHPAHARARDIASTLCDELLAICALASYWIGDGDPRKAAPVSAYPNQATLRPVPVGTEIPAWRPAAPAPATEIPARFVLMDRRCATIIATANRCYALKHGAVLTAMFLSVAGRVPELRQLVLGQLEQEGVSLSDRTVTMDYITSQLHELCLFPMNFVNANQLWTVWWHTTTHVIHWGLVGDMHQVIKDREQKHFDNICEVHKLTEAKRAQRQRRQMRKRQQRTRQEEQLEELIGIDDEDEPAEFADQSDGDDLSDLLH